MTRPAYTSCSMHIRMRCSRLCWIFVKATHDQPSLQRMKIAIIGTGAVAARHLGVLRDVPGLELVGHLSADAARSEAQARHWGGRGYSRVDHLLNSERPQAVWVCVTPDR